MTWGDVYMPSKSHDYWRWFTIFSAFANVVTPWEVQGGGGGGGGNSNLLPEAFEAVTTCQKTYNNVIYFSKSPKHLSMWLVELV